MSVRIRYSNMGNNLFVCNKTIQTNTGDVIVQYNKESRVAQIIRANGTNEVLDTFIGKNDFHIKKTLKEKLLALGARFESETRDRFRAVELQPVTIDTGD